MSSERQLDNTNNPWWGEHLNRYEEVAKLIDRKRPLKVLDIACGTGFGSFFLAQLGYNVLGGDISSNDIAECRNKYQHPNLSFEVIDGTNLPFSEYTFDVVVSFETIEHTTQYQKMLSELKRVVKTDGLVIISTPNFTVNSPSGKVLNPFHTQEWVYEELMKILSNTFSNVKLLGQQYVRYKNKNTLKFKIAKGIENIFYMRGIRKLPINLQDMIMKLMINEPMYPQSNNYALTEDVNEIKSCKTFFAICKP
jgi:ubiquinone/menaquinone biosynthesis C-methylase UbiE